MKPNYDITQALQYIGELVTNTAKENCPVDTGELRNSISYRVEGDTVIIGTNLHYAPYVEYGTGLFAVHGDGRTDVPWSYKDEEGNWYSTVGQHPQPWLQPALDVNKDKIVKIIQGAIK